MTLETIRERFWNKVQFSSALDCWEWQGSIGTNGYGRFWLDGKTVPAHRVAYELVKGKIPEEKILLHTCDNKRCVNPVHLQAGNYRDNQVDRIEKGKAGILSEVNFACRERHGSAKLTEEKAEELRRLHFDEGVRQKELCSIFSLSKGQVSKVIAGEYW